LLFKHTVSNKLLLTPESHLVLATSSSSLMELEGSLLDPVLGQPNPAHTVSLNSCGARMALNQKTVIHWVL